MASKRRQQSGEEEATAIDMREASSKVHATRKKDAVASPTAPTRKAHLPSIAPSSDDEPLHVSDISDEENTEFLARPPSSARSDNEDSRTMAVPRKLAGAPPPVPLPPPLPQPTPGPALSGALPKAPRPLPGRDAVTEAHPLGGNATAPRITRIFVSPDAQGQRRPTPEELARHVGDFDDERTAPSDPAVVPPPPRAPTVLAAPGGTSDATEPPPVEPPPPEPPPRARTARNIIGSSATGTSAETLEAEPADGMLIVDVPAGAVVFVDGVERGRGPALRVRELDRYAKHAVRIHADGFVPWKGTVSLDGRVAAKVRPNLRSRAR